MRLVWNSFLTAPSSDRVKEPFQPLFFCFNRRAYGTGVFFKAEGDTWIQTLNNPAAEKVLTYWDGLVKKGYVSTIPGFTAEYYTALGSGQIASSIEAAWGPGCTAASLNDKTAGEWRGSPLPQTSKHQ